MESYACIEGFFPLRAQSVAMPETAHSCLEMYEERITNTYPLVLIGYADVVLCMTQMVF